jgi:hypothetical protein
VRKQSLGALFGVIAVSGILIGFIRPADAILPRRDRPKVGFVTLGKTPVSVLWHRFGRGKQTTGVHPGGATEWPLAHGGCFRADGDVYTNGVIVVDIMMWTASPCDSHSKDVASLTYRGLRLGSTVTQVKHVLGPQFSFEDAYDRWCYSWVLNAKSPRYSTTVYAWFHNGRLALLSVMLT